MPAGTHGAPPGGGVWGSVEAEPDRSRYRLIRILASGGMAQVLEAVAVGSSGFERRVAIKRLLPHLEIRDEYRRMFFEEARLASRIHHGSIVQVLDYGVVDGCQFLVMEYVDGESVSRALHIARAGGTAVPLTVALHVVAEVASALEYIHDLPGAAGSAPRRIVHRDVGPENILLSTHGDVKLSDFGIALASDRMRRTMSGIVFGKERYMAPEQLRGERVGPEADVYALGATLATMLTGSSPHDSGQHARVARGEPVALPPSIPPDVATLIGRAMALAPEERPTAAAFAEHAGRFRAPRAERDGRGELREWLTALRSEMPRDGALDDLIGLMIIRVDDERSYVVEREEPSGRPTEPGKRTMEAGTIPWIRPDGEPAVPHTRPSFGRRSERPPPVSGPPPPAPSPVGPSWRPPVSVAPPASLAPPPPRRRRGLVIGALVAAAAAFLLIGGVGLAIVLGKQDEPVRAQRTIHLPPVETPPLIVPIDPTTVFDHTYEGELTDGDPRHPNDDSPIDDYFFTSPAGASISLTLTSSTFDPYLILLGPEGRVIQQNDDGAPGDLTSRIERIAEREGAYRVVANTARAQGRGPYRLHIVVRPRP